MADTEQPAEGTGTALVSPPTALDDAKDSGSTNAHDTDPDTSLEAQNNNSVDPITSKDSVTVAASPLAPSDSDRPSDIAGNSSEPTEQINPASLATNGTADSELPHKSEVEEPTTTIPDNDFGGRTTHEGAVGEDRAPVSRTEASFATDREERKDEQRRLNRELITAARDGDVDTVKKRLNEGADLYAKDSQGDNALHIAAYCSHGKVVEELLDRKPDLSIPGVLGWTALQNAVKADNDNADILASILEKSGEEVSHKSDSGKTALIQALDAKKVNSAMAILKNAYGAETINIADDDCGWTPLHYACEANLVDIVQMLLDLGADVKAVSNQNETALHIACEIGYSKVAGLLVGKKAPLNTRDHAGRTPLHVAAKNADVTIMELLLAHEDIKTVVNTQDNENRTVLFDCVQQDDHIDWVKKLIACGADLTVEDEDAWTVLTYACAFGSIRKVELLIINGVDINYRPKDGWTALHTAIGNHHPNVAKLLLDEGADITITTEEDGETALHMASRYESLKTLQLLLEKGADPREETKEGLTALQLAIKQDTKNGRLIGIELLRWLKGKDREVGIAQLASSTDWNTFDPILKEFGWTDGSNLEEPLTLICLASDSYPASHKLLCSKLEKKATKLPRYEPWTALHWAAYLGRSEIVWWLLRSLPLKGMKKTLREVILLVQDAQNSSEGQTDPPNVNQQTTESTSADRSNPEIQRQNYNVILDWLRNPPLVQIDTRAESAFLLAQEDRKKCTKIFDATITDFYKKNDRVEFLSRVRTVENVIYERKGDKNPGPTSGGVVGKLQGLTTNQKEIEPAGPQQIMEDALEQLKKRNLPFRPKDPVEDTKKDRVEYTREDLCFRWIHFPANNLEWMKHATERVYSDKATVEHDGGSALPHIIRYSWHELHGSKPEVRSLRPTCVKESLPWPRKQQKSQNVQQQKPKPTGAEDAKAEPGGEDCPIPAKQNEEVSAKTQEASDPKVDSKDPAQSRSVAEKPETYQRLALYMPYLTFGTYDSTSLHPDPKDNRDTTLFHTYWRSLKKGKNREDKDYEKGEEGVMKDAILHKTRTLDEFYYDALEDTRKRDEDQVVGRYIELHSANAETRNPGSPCGILRVDQLWLWVIDHETIITSSTHRTDLDEDPVVEGIHEYLREVKGGRRKRKPTPTSVDEMAKFITSFCIDFINRSTTECKNGELSARQIFANTINCAADEEKKLFIEFKEKIGKKLGELKEKDKSKKEPAGEREKRTTQEPEYAQEKEYQSILAATRLLVEVKDIRDELNILRYLLTQQKSVWERLHEISESFKDEHQDNIKASELSSWTQAERWKSPIDAIQDIEEMDKTALRIQDAVNSLLELEQNDVSISEAEQARKQGETLMAFTLVTIVFLPLSFLTSLFALNISIFPHKDNDLMYDAGYIFPIIFGVTAVIVIFVITLVSRVFKAKLLRKLEGLRGMKGPDKAANGGSENKAGRGEASNGGSENKAGRGEASNGGPKNEASRGVSSLWDSMSGKVRRRNRSSDEEKDPGGKGKLNGRDDAD